MDSGQERTSQLIKSQNSDRAFFPDKKALLYVTDRAMAVVETELRINFAHTV